MDQLPLDSPASSQQRAPVSGLANRDLLPCTEYCPNRLGTPKTVLDFAIIRVVTMEGAAFARWWGQSVIRSAIALFPVLS